MLYTQRTFTLPAGGNNASQKNWDRAFLSEAEFAAKYSQQSESNKPAAAVPPAPKQRWWNKLVDAIGNAIGNAKFGQ